MGGRERAPSERARYEHITGGIDDNCAGSGCGCARPREAFGPRQIPGRVILGQENILAPRGGQASLSQARVEESLAAELPGQIEVASEIVRDGADARHGSLFELFNS